MKKTAIILGATGLTGHIILQKLIRDDRYDHIKLFSRSRIEGLPEKVTQFIGNLLELENFKADFTGNEVYCCIGTTKSKTPDKSLYRDIDYGIPVAAAALSKENKIDTFLVISAMGADKNSRIFYNKTKGEMEDGVIQQNIKNTFILRPSLIGGNRDEKRLAERVALSVMKLIEPLFIGKLKDYKIIEPETIATTMIYLSNHPHHTKTVITSNNIKEVIKQ